MPHRHLVFDVNETLLDLAPLDPVFESLFGDADARKRWFASLLHWSTVTTLTGEYRDFSQLADACLDAMAGSEELSNDAKQQVFDTIAQLTPHPEVPDALAMLREHGFKLVALTNSAQKTVDQQFANAGLAPLFDHVLSVDHARKYKPHPAAYAVAANALDCDLFSLRLIAAHDWDITGAIRAGCAGAFVARNGETVNPVGEAPDILGSDLGEVAQRIVEQDKL
ncbi:haloacid dehalogenase type II [Salinisphaera sp.]|uniref:haloacid dehalogenase type II n=1 Tax=Salinisphaera sp. TaxID=1914330 RepID=UPI000C35FD0D|nr:haloacid dehalogenase type II [Salinisphaera sp.]MBS62867.1 haloacid dehalogenase type II [Salinisphaera sp.]